MSEEKTNETKPEEPKPGFPVVPYQPLLVRGKNLGEAWENGVRMMMSQGYNRFIKAPEYQTWTKDSPMILIVDNAFAQPRLSSKAPLTQEMADEYAEKLMNGMEKTKENSFDYTYYSRLRHYPDCIVRAGMPNVADEHEMKDYVRKVCDGKCVVQRIDQVEKVIEIFKKDPTRRTAVMHTWIPMRDLAKFTPERKDTSSPCLVIVHPQIVENKLHFNVVMKTNDLYSAWPGNAYAFTTLQKHIADQLNVGVGHYTHFSVSMQIYEEMFELAEELVKNPVLTKNK